MSFKDLIFEGLMQKEKDQVLYSVEFRSNYFVGWIHF